MIESGSKLGAALLLPLLLVGCLLTPGKFTSSLDVARDGSFTFRYEGEIILVTNKSMMDQAGQSTAFEPECEDEAGDRRDCTVEEIAEARRKFDEEQKAKAEREAKESAEMATMLGGIDPNNEATMTEFAARLEREAGWKSVKHRGEGIFDVEYEVVGKLDRDFVFPLFPRFNFIVPAVMITRRDDNAVLVRAPGFGDPSGSGAGSSGMGPMTGGGSKAEGVFTIRTDAQIATNNSEEGASTQQGKQVVQWRVTPLNRNAPEALLRLSVR
jgi:hypothetical protein